MYLLYGVKARERTGTCVWLPSFCLVYSVSKECDSVYVHSFKTTRVSTWKPLLLANFLMTRNI